MTRQTIRQARFRPRLRPEDRRAWLFAPCGAVREPWRSRGIALLESAGREVHTGRSMDAPPSPFAAGPPELRLADWQAGLEAGMPVLLPARGGYGGIHLAGQMPLAAMTQQQPLWVGSSDCTFLQTPLLAQAGLVTFYGPAPCGQLAEPEEHVARAAFSDLLAGNWPASTPLSGAEVLVEGFAEGELRGGCLSILAACAGTPLALDARDAIVILEDTGEHPYRIERLLLQLEQSGGLQGARGLLFGTFPGCVDRSGNPDLTREVVSGFARRLGLPAWFACPLGHGRDAIPVPLGTWTRMQDTVLHWQESPFAVA